MRRTSRLVSGAFIYYVSMEHSFRNTSRIESSSYQDHLETIRERDATMDPPPAYEGPESDLERKTRERREQLYRENEEAKRRFMELPAVESNHEGGAIPRSDSDNGSDDGSST